MNTGGSCEYCWGLSFFFWFSQTWPVTLRIQEYVFFGCIVLPDSKETELGSRDQEDSPWASKNTRILMWILLKCLSVILYDRLAFSEDHKKLLQGLVSHELTAYHSVFNIFLTHWIMTILSKGCKLDNFEPHYSLKLSFTNTRGLCSNFVES